MTVRHCTAACCSDGILQQACSSCYLALSSPPPNKNGWNLKATIGTSLKKGDLRAVHPEVRGTSSSETLEKNLLTSSVSSVGLMSFLHKTQKASVISKTCNCEESVSCLLEAFITQFWAVETRPFSRYSWYIDRNTSFVWMVNFLFY